MEAALEAGDGQLASCCFEAVGVEHPPQVKTLKAAVVDRREAMQLLMGYNSFNGYVWNKLFDLRHRGMPVLLPSGQRRRKPRPVFRQEGV